MNTDYHLRVMGGAPMANNNVKFSELPDNQKKTVTIFMIALIACCIFPVLFLILPVIAVIYVATKKKMTLTPQITELTTTVRARVFVRRLLQTQNLLITTNQPMKYMKSCLIRRPITAALTRICYKY